MVEKRIQLCLNPCNESATIPATTIMSESIEEPSSPTHPQTMLPRSNKNQFILAATLQTIDA